MSHKHFYTLLFAIALLVAYQLYVSRHEAHMKYHKQLNRAQDLEERLIRPKTEQTFSKEAFHPLDARDILLQSEGQFLEQSTQARSKETLSLNLITVNFKGRLGNRMFEYASLLGIAERNNLTAFVSANADLNFFRIKAKVYSNSYFTGHFMKYIEKKGCTFEPEVLHLGSRNDVLLDGYFQSWRYFDSYGKVIRQNFKWINSIAEEARRQFENFVSPNLANYVGVHVRRGDMVHNEEYTRYGYISADGDYISRAMDHFRAKLKNVLFVVVSDDLNWCKENIRGEDVRFVQEGNTPETDMAILTQCNHTIMTTGSYGWWSAWLTGGDVVYYKRYPRFNSKLAALFTPKDYWPPSWIAL